MLGGRVELEEHSGESENTERGEGEVPHGRDSPLLLSRAGLSR